MNKKKSLFYILLLVLSLTVSGCTDNNDKEDGRKAEEKPAETPMESEEPSDAEKHNDREDDKNKADEEEDKVEQEKNKDNKEIIEEFRAIKGQDPSPDVLIKYIDENIEKVSEEDADELIETLEMNLEENRNVYEERIMELDKDNELIEIDGSEREFNKENIQKIRDEKLKVEVDYLYKNMYKLVNVEGGFYPIIDYDKLKEYAKNADKLTKDYINLRAMESDERSMSDGGLVISFDELSERIIKAEDYLKSSSKGKRREEVLEEYQYKMEAYLNGLPNTPVMDYESNKIREEVLESYDKTIEKESDFSKIVEQHLKNIEDNDNIIDEDIIEKASSLLKEQIEKLRNK